MKVCCVKDVCIGEGKPKICLPIVGHNDEEILSQLDSFQDLTYDLIELRIDYYQDMKDNEKVKCLLRKLRAQTDVPLLLTYRSLKEGGCIQLSDQEYKKLIQIACESHCIDLVDIELMSGNALVFELVEIAHQNKIKVVMSNHDFQGTPSSHDMMDRLEKMEILGGDICKLAVMPQTYKDVIRLLNVTLEMSKRLNRPVVTMSMGDLGKISRIAGELTGSSITFASGHQASAPGQIPANQLNALLEAIHHD
ncbi:type I 3-dehydroquinate dehydratase [Longibaculum muris]|uniref:type I 3-dehydroquinate dehydratase n=1 Tax=Longibaculum muris TaxID=1796628 RepID=UPI0012B9AC60|nr:type I 3-dehydroquinate dehydratase [Longibaculum muris]